MARRERVQVAEFSEFTYFHILSKFRFSFNVRFFSKPTFRVLEFLSSFSPPVPKTFHFLFSFHGNFQMILQALGVRVARSQQGRCLRKPAGLKFPALCCVARPHQVFNFKNGSFEWESPLLGARVPYWAGPARRCVFVSVLVLRQEGERQE